MARMGKVDFRQLEEFTKKVEENLGDDQMDLFIKACAKELAARLLTKVIRRTPVGDYSKAVGVDKVGGTLRRGWTGEQHLLDRFRQFDMQLRSLLACFREFPHKKVFNVIGRNRGHEKVIVHADASGNPFKRFLEHV